MTAGTDMVSGRMPGGGPVVTVPPHLADRLRLEPVDQPEKPTRKRTTKTTADPADAPSK